MTGSAVSPLGRPRDHRSGVANWDQRAVRKLETSFR
jgi:hypothetical protein